MTEACLYHGSMTELRELERPLRELLRDFTYRPGWRFTVEDGRLQVRATVIDAYNHDQTCPLQYAAYLPRGVPESFNWARWLYEQILNVERHEAGEFFQLAEKRPFDPHDNQK